ncbi:phosphoglycerate mutase [Elstera litoralis]|uniref:Phosphoglycerate mutase n=1 Tax=Elstera litoralis TaxID=552518 RepID=A0A0F3IYG8_9PROT|nr:phosphoglycerate mutase [Elstera litoralis]
MLIAVVSVGVLGPSPAQGSEAAAWAALRQGGIVLFRHANAPGGGDPAGMRIDDCTTQRNLDDSGRAQSRRIGEAFRSRTIEVGAVLTSQWCRARDTADLAFPGRKQDETAFNSFFSDGAKGPAQTAAARRILADWRGPGALVVVTHQVNITALTGIVPTSGEGVVVMVEAGNISAIGRIRP